MLTVACLMLYGKLRTLLSMLAGEVHLTQHMLLLAEQLVTVCRKLAAVAEVKWGTL